MSDLPQHSHKLVTTTKAARKVLDYLSEEKLVAIDIETGGLDWWDLTVPIVGLGLGVLKGETVHTWYLPLWHIEEPHLEEDEIRRALCDFLNSPAAKFGANIKFDTHFLERDFGPVAQLNDVQVLARLLRSNLLHKGVALDKLIESEFGSVHEEWHELIKVCRKMKLRVSASYVAPMAYAMVPTELLGRYCGRDVYWTLLLAYRYLGELRRDKALLNLYRRLERPLLRDVVDMESEGLIVDVAYLAGLKRKLVPRIEELQKTIHEHAGKEFDIESPLQTGAILRKLGVDPQMRRRKRTKGKVTEITETESYDAACLRDNVGTHPIVQDILDYRAAAKLLATYVSPLLGDDEKATTRRIHVGINQDAARTGRFGCSLLMNLPRPGEEGFKAEYSIRHAFIPKGKGATLVTIDYSQIEYRLCGHFTNDKKLLEIFHAGQDIHGMVASVLFKVPADKVTKEQRSKAKNFNFAQIYGAGVQKLSVMAGLPEAKIRSLMDTYARSFPNVGAFRRLLEEDVARCGYVQTPFGRKRLIDKKMTYTAFNSLIQGTAADILKIAIHRVSKYLSTKLSKLLLPVHDELVIDWDFRDGDIVPKICSLMTSFPKMFRVPMEVEASICPESWGEKRKYTPLDGVSAELNDPAGVWVLFHADPYRKRWWDFIKKLCTDQGFELSHDEMAAVCAEIDRAIRARLRRKEFVCVVKEGLRGKGWLDEDDRDSMPDLPWDTACEGGERVETVYVSEARGVQARAARRKPRGSASHVRGDK